MMSLSHLPTILSFIEKANSISELQQVHGHMLKTGLFKDTCAASRLISFAATNPNPQTIAYAHSIFSHIDSPNSFIWNSMIRAYANSSNPENSLVIFCQMLAEGTIIPDKYTFPFVIKACSAFGGLKEGQQVHGHLVKRADIRNDIYVQNTLINMYGNLGYFVHARYLLDRMPHRDVVSWNALLSAFVGKGLLDCARSVFDEMEERNVESWNFLISGYAGSGLVEEARRIFDEMPQKDVVSWNAIMSGYANVGQFTEVLVLFENMLSEGVQPDNYTLVKVLSACAHLGALSQGEWIHAYIDKNGISIKGFLATALVDMYSKCGDITKAVNVFSNSLTKDVSTWNSVIGGLSINGYGEHAVSIFHQMLLDGCHPTEVTFINVLSACSHAGLLFDGLAIFDLMIHGYVIQPTIEHYGCMVDMLGRCGLLEEAKEFLGVVPMTDSPALWQSLLASCINHGNVELAQFVAEKLLKLDPQDNAAYVQLSNVYASTGKWKTVAELRRNMREQGVRKEPGCSMIEINGVVYEFLAGEGLVSKQELMSEITRKDIAVFAAVVGSDMADAALLYDQLALNECT
uniref:Uncharacterized protein n=1 Tax=Opuntia streptacantha TaxID=393608 RepID=A0A7C9EX76_OPUST